MPQDNYQYLLQKLDKFTRKFYGNELIKGSLYFLALGLAAVLGFSILEYFGQFSKNVRTVFFFTAVVFFVAVLVRYIAIPLLKLLKLGKQISRHQAAIIVGKHFPEVQDKLLNTLQLHEENGGSRSLIQASIDQKALELKPVPFQLAVDFKSNKKYVKYALIPLAILLILLIQMPDVVLDSSARIISYDREFAPVAPFSFNLQNEKMQVLQNDDFTLRLKVEGEEIPATVYLNTNGQNYRMVKNSPTEFEYTLKNVGKDMPLYFSAASFNSKGYEIKVLPKPYLKAFKVSVNYPEYTGKENEVLENTGDFTVPEGSEVQWTFSAENTEKIHFIIDGKKLSSEQLSENEFRFKRQFLNSTEYYLQTTNSFVPENDSMGYQVQVIKDARPSINVEMSQDSNSLKNYFFSGEISDDYGISALNFYYRFTSSEDKAKTQQGFQKQAIGVSSRSIQSFFHQWNLASIGYKAGDELEFYFQVWDNDQVNGSKSSKSQRFYVKAPTKDEVQEMVTKSSNEIKDDLQNAIKEAAEVQKDLEDVKNRLRNKKKLDWEDKQAVKKLLEKQENMQKSMKELNKNYKDMLKQQDEFNELDEKLREKHKQLQELFEKLMSDEMKEMMEELEKMMEENKEGLDEKMEDMELDNEELEKELDAALEHFKQLELEQKMDETIEKLEELSKEQKDLAEKTENKEESNEELEKSQQKLNEKFEEIKEDLKDIGEKNKSLERPHDMEDTKEKESEIGENMEESKEEIGNNKNKKAGEKQKDAAEKMDELGEQMKSMKQEMKSESLSLDYDALRQIMENLIHLSFEQEQLMDELREINSYNPKFVALAQEQMKLKGDAKMIEDSLISLSKRVMQISGFINKEVGEMNRNLEKTIENLSKRNIGAGRRYQQETMTHINNLAVMLSEVMQQMQKQMAQQMEGKQNCNNPNKQKGKSKGNQNMKKQLGDMRQMQEDLNKQLGEMKKRMDQGKRPLSKELAKKAAQQEALRKKLRELEQMKDAAGEKPSNELKEMQKLMDETEEDIVNQRITNETMRRQQEILNKLLESEKAEREQEFSKERESNTANQQQSENDKAFEEYKRRKLKEIELLNSVPPQLNNYYKQKVKEYFEELD